ncbi:MAG: hypothetical protein JO339_13905 [Alphaproteobacteria bacterium]|nr:hypothetical protein [Alphaproteobacteria bacterium]
MGQTLGEAPLSAALSSTSYRALETTIGTALNDSDAERPSATKKLQAMLDHMALLVDSTAAAALIARLATWGLSTADPLVDLLHLNAALAPERAP